MPGSGRPLDRTVGLSGGQFSKPLSPVGEHVSNEDLKCVFQNVRSGYHGRK